MTKIKTVKKKLKIDVTKNRGCQEITKQSYDKNQGYQEKIKPRYIRKSRSPRKKKVEDSYKN